MQPYQGCRGRKETRRHPASRSSPLFKATLWASPVPPRPHSGLWEDTTSSLSSGASCQSGGSAGGQGAQSVEGSDSSLHCWGGCYGGGPLALPPLEQLWPRYPGKGSSYRCGRHTGPRRGPWGMAREPGLAWRWGGVCCMRRMSGSQPAKEGGRSREGGVAPWARRAGGSDEVRV